MKPALLVIDIQKDFFNISPLTAQSLRDAIWTVNAAIALFRKHQLPVICVQHMEEEDNLVPGEEKFDLPDGLDILETDLHIHKVYGNAFNKTGLAETLRAMGVDTVIITGFCAEYCILSTTRGATDMDFHAIILRGSIASSSLENIKFVESVNELISFGALKTVLA